MFRAARLQADMASQPAALQDQPRRRRELAKIFAQKARRFVGEKPIALPWLRFISRRQQFARDFALFVDRKQILFQPEEKILGLPFRWRRADSKTGNRNALSRGPAGGGKSVLQPRFQFGFQIRIKQTLQHIVLPLPDGWRLFPTQI